MGVPRMCLTSEAEVREGGSGIRKFEGRGLEPGSSPFFFFGLHLSFFCVVLFVCFTTSDGAQGLLSILCSEIWFLAGSKTPMGMSGIEPWFVLSLQAPILNDFCIGPPKFY